MPLEMFWGGAPALQPTGRDEAIAAGAELRKLGLQDVGEDSTHHVIADGDEGSDNEPDYYNPQTGETVNNTTKGHPRDLKQSHAPGGVAPVPKRIRADYDSDDARIIELKQHGHSNKAIETKLAEEGRMRYTATTIGSRWMRLKKLIEEKEDERLDDELTDWHVEDDENLKSIADVLEKKYEEARKRLEEKRDRDIATHLAQKMGKKKYTKNACRERLAGLADGTALPPIELDPDPAKRRVMREERIRKATEARAEEYRKKQEADEAKQSKTERKKAEAAEANQLRVQANLKKKAEKAERQRVKDERKAGHEAVRKRKQLCLKIMRLERDWYQEKERGEKALFRRLTGKSINAKDNLGRGIMDSYDSDESDINDLESDEEDEMLSDDDESEESDDERVYYPGGDTDEEEDEANFASTPVKPQPLRRRSSRPVQRKAQVPDGSSPEPEVVSPNASRKKALVKAAGNAGAPAVTKETLANPRSILNDTELYMLLYFRGLPRRGQHESHAEVVARLDAADRALTGAQVDDLLGALLEKVRGSKAARVRHLQEVDAQKSDKGQQGVQPTDLAFIQQYEGYQGVFSYLIDEYAAQMEADDVEKGRKDSMTVD